MKMLMMLWAIVWGLSQLNAMEALSFRQALDKTRLELLISCQFFKQVHHLEVIHDSNMRCDAAGNTRLHWLVVSYSEYKNNNYLREIDFLLSHELTRFNIENKYGVTAFDLAEDRREEEIIRIMLKDNEMKESCRVRDYIDWIIDDHSSSQGNTVLHRLVALRNKRYGSNYLFKEIERCLDERRARYDVQNMQGLTAFDLANFFQDRRIMELMLRKDLNVSPEFFIHLVCSGNVFAVRILLEKPELEVNFLSFNYTALHYAVLNLDYEMVKVLLEHPKINPNVQDWRGNTVLHLLVLWNNSLAQPEYSSLIDLLLSHSKTRCDIRNYKLSLPGNLSLSKNQFSHISAWPGVDKEGGKTVYELVVDKLIKEKMHQHHLLFE